MVSWEKQPIANLANKGRNKMRYIITFETSFFDVSREDKNPTNQIHGQSLLLWIKEQVPKDFSMEKIDPEDWGWYTFINFKNRKYMLGAIALKGNDDYEWILQIEKQRSLKEKLLGKAKMKEDDECLLFFKSLIDSKSEFHSANMQRA